jgi:hypothetical protein
MEIIEFVKIDVLLIEGIKSVFELISSGKKNGHIDEVKLEEILGERFQSKFIHTKSKSDEWLAKWNINPNIEMPWDFGSWVDALIESEIELKSLEIDAMGNGSIKYKQLAWPTGGIDALKEIVRIFDGKLSVNNGI